MQTAQISPQNSTQIPESNSADNARSKFQQLIRGRRTLTEAYLDKEGREIQLWNVPQYGLAGSVVDGEGRITLIPGSKIRNPLNPQETPDSLLKRLEGTRIKRWDITYDARAVALTLWPHLEAAGKDFIIGHGYSPGGERQPPRVSTLNNGRISRMSEADVIHLLNQKPHYMYDKTRERWVNERTGRTFWINKSEKYIEVGYDQRAAKQDRAYHREQNVLRLHKKEISNDQFHQAVGSHDRRSHAKENYSNTAHWRLSYGKEPPKGGGSNPSGAKPPGGKSPAEAQFKETVKSTGLAKSYNASHPNNPIQGKGAGQIGGVACGSTAYIEGLFDTPESLLEQEHFFYLPKLDQAKLDQAKLDQEQAPFSNAQLSQILREVASGIYNGAVPWFSLHFSAKGDLYPVIHPLYANTLVGRVIGMLDYFMKGYLNGGVFQEEFVDRWAMEREKDPNWSSKTAWDKLVDFEEYCEKNLKGEDKRYQSLRRMHQNTKNLKAPAADELQRFLAQHGLQNAINAEEFEKRLSALGLLSKEEEPEILKNFSGFKNSFRIIARQNSVQKEGPLFVIDSDFDVEYTILPSPQYQEALDLYQRQHGCFPPSYRKMLVAYDMMREKIHGHMVKMPLCRDYFSMLRVINFFSSYFSTLKKHHKIPLLPPVEAHTSKGCPSLFPHLPIKTLREARLDFRLGDVWDSVIKEHRAELAEHLSRSYLAKAEPKTELLKAFEESVIKSILKRVVQVTPRTVEDIEKDLTKSSLKEIVKQMIGDLETRFSSGNKRENNIKPYASKFLDDLLKDPDCDDIAILGPVKYETISFGEDITREEMEEGKKVVGGCGLHLEAQPVKASPEAAQILHTYGPSLFHLPPETWKEISKESEGAPTGSLFRLFFEDMPLWVDDDYGWMEALLHLPKEEDKERIEILEAMAEGNREGFSQLIQNDKLREMKDSEGRTLLHHAATLGDPFYLQEMLKKGLAQTEDLQGYLPIHYAAMNGAMGQMEALYQRDKKSLDAKSRNGNTPLISAIQGGQLQAVRFALSHKALLHSSSDGNNPIHWALQGTGDFAIIDELLKVCESNLGSSSALLNQYSEEMGLPLLQACELDSPELVQRFITLGADPKAVRKDGKTAIEIAIRRNCAPMLECLLKKASPAANAYEAAAAEGSLEILGILTNLPGFYEHRNAFKDNMLHVAIRNGNIQGALLILRKHPHLTYLEVEKNAAGETAGSLVSKLGLWEIVEAFHERHLKLDLPSLIRAGYHPLLRKIFDPLPLKAEELESYLLAAAEAGNYEAITHLLEPKGAQLDNFRGPTGWSLAHYLARCDGLYLFKRLCAKSSKFVRRLPQEGNKTLAYHAAQYGSEAILQFLLEQYKQQNIALEKQYRDRHLLYAVIESGQANMCLWMFERFDKLADVELDSRGSRPVHLAAKMGSIAILKLLEKQGADLKALDKEGHTALDLSLRAGTKEASEFLRSKDVPEVVKKTSKNEEKLKPSPETLPLHFAAAKGNTANLKELLEKQPELIDAEDSQGCTPLFYAMESHLETGAPLDNVKLLIQRGADLRHYSHQLVTPLLLACRKGSLALVGLLLECGADPNQTGTLQTGIFGSLSPLDLSVSLQHREISRHLLKHGAKADHINGKGSHTAHLSVEAGDLPLLRLLAAKGVPLNRKDSKGMEPLHYAAAKGEAQTVETLFALQASIDSPLETPVETDQKGVDGATSLHLAALSGQPEVVSTLLKHHADPQAKSKAGHSLLSFASMGRAPESVFKQLERYRLANDPQQLRQALSAAIAHDNVDSMILLYGKVPLHTDLEQGHTGLHFACRHGSLQCARWLLAQGADPLQTCATGENALELAAAQGSHELLKLFLEEAPWKVDQSNVRGETLMHISAKAGKLGNVLLLLLQGASLSSQDEYGYSPLHLAARNGHTAVVNFLLSCGADPQARSLKNLRAIDLVQDKDGATQALLKEAESLPRETSPLHLALKYRNSLAVQALTHLVDCDQPDDKGTTPLHIAAQTRQVQSLLYLLQAGAGVDSKDKQGCTPLWYAALTHANPTIARLLVQAGADPKATDLSGKSIVESVRLTESPQKAELLKIMEQS